MPYIKKTTRIKKKNKIHMEKVYSARYGKNTIPGPKKKVTRESVKKVNERNRIKKLAWIIDNNYEPGDWHVTFTFRKEERTSDKEEIREIKKQLLKELKKVYQSSGSELKYIFVIEKLKTCVHFHVILNDIPHLGKLVNGIWKKGRVYFSPLYESEGFLQLASYLVKEAGEKEKGEMAYTHSRNLDIPVTEVEIISSRKWRKSPKPPKGYYIEKGSYYEGINDWGYKQQYYTLIKYQKEDEP